MRFGQWLPTRRISEVGEQLLEERIEAVELAEPFEAPAHQPIPPFALEAANLLGVGVPDRMRAPASRKMRAEIPR